MENFPNNHSGGIYTAIETDCREVMIAGQDNMVTHTIDQIVGPKNYTNEAQCGVRDMLVPSRVFNGLPYADGPNSIGLPCGDDSVMLKETI
ncbi:Aspartate aminotransferase [Sesbania bispinosa]|nr:Aspartate aminotransferase [Sesbania bispinosa]